MLYRVAFIFQPCPSILFQFFLLFSILQLNNRRNSTRVHRTEVRRKRFLHVEKRKDRRKEGERNKSERSEPEA